MAGVSDKIVLGTGALRPPHDHVRECGRRDFRAKRRLYSGLIPDALMTLAHFAASSAMKAANSPAYWASSPGAEIGETRPDRRIGGAALKALLRVSMIATGVLRGTPKPTQALAS